ncbi:MAG TPA: ATP-binding protein [Ramlibacter sp.]|uniref:sensor histidine kinase n=1 Tax=Ramlibacter sp. TaxID=1917967 RepID=UPI002ED1C6CD
MSRLAGALLLLLVLVLGGAAALLQLGAPPAEAHLVDITQAAFLKSDAPQPPAADAPWTVRSLPDNWNRSNPGQSGYGWYRAVFELPQAPTEAWAAYLPTVATTHQLVINGVTVGGGPMTGIFVRSFGRPQLNAIAPQLLHAGRNELLLRLRVAPNLRGGLGPLTLGPQPLVEPMYHRDLALRVTLPRSLNMALVFVGVLVLLLWLRRPEEGIYGLFAALALVWSLRNFHYTVDSFGVPSSIWEAFVLGSLGLVVVLQWTFMRRYTGHPAVAMERFVLAAAVLAVPVFALLDPLLVRALRLPWYVLCAAMGAWSILLLVRHLRRPTTTGAGPWVILAGMVLTLLLGLTDLGVSAQLLPFGPAARMAYGAPLLLCALVYALAENYFRTYDDARALNAELERRVQERAEELQRTHERLRALEREATVAAERDRLMRDMHDGIGSQLITTLDAVQRGKADSREVERHLRDCIDDLRLVIDSLEPERDSLQLALGNLRYRLEPRLRAAGLHLEWAVDDGVALPSPSAALQVLRIVQEAVTNVLKHAGAGVLRLACRSEGDELVLHVEDDGRGFDDGGQGASPAHRGLKNMRLRAQQQLHGSLEIASSGAGTRLTLRVPLQAGLSAGGNTLFSG